MNKYLRAIRWKNRYDKWDRQEIEADIFVIIIVTAVAYLIIWSLS